LFDTLKARTVHQEICVFFSWNSDTRRKEQTDMPQAIERAMMTANILSCRHGVFEHHNDPLAYVRFEAFHYCPSALSIVRGILGAYIFKRNNFQFRLLYKVPSKVTMRV
jgi:hypothetical protein